jgi:hypothetical protein
MCTCMAIEFDVSYNVYVPGLSCLKYYFIVISPACLYINYCASPRDVNLVQVQITVGQKN